MYFLASLFSLKISDKSSDKYTLSNSDKESDTLSNIHRLTHTIVNFAENRIVIIIMLFIRKIQKKLGNRLIVSMLSDINVIFSNSLHSLVFAFLVNIQLNIKEQIADDGSRYKN